MNGNGLAAVVAALCVVAVGVSASSLDASISTDPDEVLNVDFDRLPIGVSNDDVRSMKEEIKSNAGDGSEDTADDRRGSGGQREERSRSIDRESDQRSAGGGDPSDRNRAANGGDRRARGGAGSVPVAPPDLLEMLLELLRRLLPVALILAAAALVMSVAYRYGDSLRAALARTTGTAGVDRREGGAPRARPRGEPAGEIDRAWLALVERLDIERPQTKTPEECASAAVDAGMDPEAVEEITRTFEEVRYGDAPMTDERRQRLRRGLGRLDIDPGGTA